MSQKSNLIEKLPYQQVIEEIDSGVIKEEIFEKALTDCEGNEREAKSLYIRYRLKSLVDDLFKDVEDSPEGFKSEALEVELLAFQLKIATDKEEKEQRELNLSFNPAVIMFGIFVIIFLIGYAGQ